MQQQEANKSNSQPDDSKSLPPQLSNDQSQQSRAIETVIENLNNLDDT